QVVLDLKSLLDQYMTRGLVVLDPKSSSSFSHYLTYGHRPRGKDYLICVV
ncbi:hypothetical protein PanWU01x14_352280, partial [Parasponia andersonii]